MLYYFLPLFLAFGNQLLAQTYIKSISWKESLEQNEAWYLGTEASRIADNVLVYQHQTGGWPKNIDMASVLSPEEIEFIKKEKHKEGTKLSRATIDNEATTSQMRYLAKVYKHTGKTRFREGFLKGIQYLIESQYESGGWPQYYPIREGYYEHITFNDDAMVNSMHILKEVFSDFDEFKPLQISNELKIVAQNAFEKGIQCFLNTQIISEGKLSVWCAQHDSTTLAPAKARSYELPSFSGSESVGIVLLLMDIDNPSREVINSINGAVQWFENNRIEGIKLETEISKDGSKNRIVVEDENATTLWGRFYDLETSEIFFCSRDGIKRNSLGEISDNRRNGYSWFTNAPEKVLSKYAEWEKKLDVRNIERPRVIVSTDIGGTDPDDFQSMIHYLMYADRFDTEGLISSPYGNGRKEHILEMINLYELDFPKLKQHEDFPEPDLLRAITKQGSVSFAPPKGYNEKSTEGSRWIVERANAKSDRPLWVLVWGGLEDLAQALHDAPEIENKIRVYWIGGPNKKWSVHAYLYIAHNFPNLFMIESNATYRGWFIEQEINEQFGNKGFFENFINSRGAMGNNFGNYYKGELKMGDTPSVAYLISGEPEKPNGESWGGSFVPLPYSALRVFDDHSSKNDTVPVYSVNEWTFTGKPPNNSSKESNIYMEIDGQRIEGYYEGNGNYKVRFVPKKVGNWHYTLICDDSDIDGAKGEFVSTNSWPG